MRLVVRFLGVDVFELATGPDPQPEPDAIQAVAGSVAADLQPAPAPFGIAGHDQPWNLPDE